MVGAALVTGKVETKIGQNDFNTSYSSDYFDWSVTFYSGQFFKKRKISENSSIDTVYF